MALQLDASGRQPGSGACRLPQAARMAIKIGLLGGSFDPVHLAHIALATTALQSLDLAQVELIPAAQPWQRSPMASNGEQRMAMLNLAIRAQQGRSEERRVGNEGVR